MINYQKELIRLKEMAATYRQAALNPRYPGQEITLLESVAILEKSAKKVESKLLKKSNI